jgi:hypothetical protein
MGGEQFLLQGVEPIGAAGGEREIAAHGGEAARHPLTEAGAGASDQDALTDGVRHPASMPHPVDRPVPRRGGARGVSGGR